jgi:hypothetical protein
MKEINSNTENLSQVNENQSEYSGFINKSEDEKLKQNVMRSPIKKLQLFTKMLRRESVLKKAKISHT